MAQSIVSLTTRRFRAVTLTAIVAVLVAAVLLASSLALRGEAFLSGWTLLGVMLFLAGYNLRKKLTYPPLGSSSGWLHLHVYVGLLSIVLFLGHTGLRLPRGPLETSLAALFAAVALSGIAGLFLSRAVPPRLAVRGQEVLFERIPIFRRQLRERAETLVLQCAEQTSITTLADFYTRRLVGFFAGPCHFWAHLLQSTRPVHILMDDLRSMGRYLNDEERRIAAELGELIEAKDRLDYHRAMQLALKGWLFVHIPLTYALLMLALAHAVLVHAFFAGIR